MSEGAARGMGRDGHTVVEQDGDGGVAEGTAAEPNGAVRCGRQRWAAECELLEI